MNGLRKEFLSRSCFAQNQYRRVKLRYVLGFFDRRPHRRRLADNIVKIKKNMRAYDAVSQLVHGFYFVQHHDKTLLSSHRSRIGRHDQALWLPLDFIEDFFGIDGLFICEWIEKGRIDKQIDLLSYDFFFGFFKKCFYALIDLKNIPLLVDQKNSAIIVFQYNSQVIFSDG